MTEADFRNLCRSLGSHLAILHEDMETDGLHAARQSQTGARTTTVRGRPPCNIADLDYLITDDEKAMRPSPESIIRGWCRLLCETAGITLGPVANQPTNVWCGWLWRNHTAVFAATWAQDCIDELTDLEAELRAKLYPTMPNFSMTLQQLPDLFTADQLCDAFGVKPATIRKWRERGKVEAAGRQTLSTGETLDLLRWTTA